MDLMGRYPDKYFDLAIVDPPYGIRQDGHRENNRGKVAVSKKYHPGLWDQPEPTKEYFIELERVSKNQIIWGGNHLAHLINRKSSCWLVWNKHSSGSFADCELAFTSFDTAVRLFDYPWNGMIQGYHGDKKKNEERIHPTQKPVALYMWILKNYAKNGGRVLDTHVGSGSSRIACDKLVIDFMGCEIDKVYFDAQEKRWESYKSQLRMF